MAGSLPNRIKEHPWMAMLCVFAAFVMWHFPLGILQSWSAVEQKTVPQWLAENGWPPLKYLLLGWYGLFALMFAIGLFVVIRACRKPEQPTIEEREAKDGRTDKKPEPRKPKTLLDLFRTDFPNHINLHDGYNITVNNQITGEKAGVIPCQVEVLADLDAKSKFLALYIPPTLLTEAICGEFINLHKKVLTDIQAGLGVEGGIHGERFTSMAECHFTGRIYVYHETVLMTADKEKLERQYEKKKLSAIFRGQSYMIERNNPRPFQLETAS